MPTCREVTRWIASDELTNASWRRTLATRLHLLKCPPCRRFLDQIRSIGRAVRNLYRLQEIDAASLERLEGAILKTALKT